MHRDEAFGAEFMNIDHQVGMTGKHDDVLLVQVMLKFVFKNDPNLKKFVSDDELENFVPNGKPGKKTRDFIVKFQKNFLRRPKPEGFVNKAHGDDNNKVRFTIYQLFAHTQETIDTWKPERENVFNLIKMGFIFAEATTGPQK